MSGKPDNHVSINDLASAPSDGGAPAPSPMAAPTTPEELKAAKWYAIGFLLVGGTLMLAAVCVSIWIVVSFVTDWTR